MINQVEEGFEFCSVEHYCSNGKVKTAVKPQRIECCLRQDQPPDREERQNEE